MTCKEAGLENSPSSPPSRALRGGTDQVIYSHNYSLKKLGLIFFLIVVPFQSYISSWVANSFSCKRS